MFSTFSLLIYVLIITINIIACFDDRIGKDVCSGEIREVQIEMDILENIDILYRCVL